VHRQAWLYVVSAGRTADPAAIAKLETIRRAFEGFFASATGGRMSVEDRRGTGPRRVRGPVDGDVRPWPAPDVGGRLVVRVQGHRQDVAEGQLVLPAAGGGHGEREGAEAHGEAAIGAADQAARPEAPARGHDGAGRGLERGVGMTGGVHAP